jgi:transposase
VCRESGKHGSEEGSAGKRRSLSDYYLAEAAGIEVWLVNSRDLKNVPGRGKSDVIDCVWQCKLNERGMLRRSFVPGEDVRDLRRLTRTRARLAREQAAHRNQVEKTLEDALIKVSSVISDLFGASGRAFLNALISGERSPAKLAGLGDERLKATKKQLAEALTGRFREIHAIEIGVHLRVIDAVTAEIKKLDAEIETQIRKLPGTAAVCTGCGEISGTRSPCCEEAGAAPLPLAERLAEITGISQVSAAVIIAELGTDPSVFATPGHAAAWARLTPRTNQSGSQSRPGRAGKGDSWLRSVLGTAAMSAGRTDTRLGAQYRRIVKKRGKKKAIVAISRVICETAWILICDPGARYTELGPDYHVPHAPARATRDRIREIERLNPGKKVILADADAA